MTGHTPLLLLFLVIILILVAAPQSCGQSHRAEHTLRRFDRDVALPSLRSSTSLLTLLLLLVVVM